MHVEDKLDVIESYHFCVPCHSNRVCRNFVRDLLKGDCRDWDRSHVMKPLTWLRHYRNTKRFSESDHRALEMALDVFLIRAE